MVPPPIPIPGVSNSLLPGGIKNNVCLMIYIIKKIIGTEKSRKYILSFVRGGVHDGSGNKYENYSSRSPGGVQKEKKTLNMKLRGKYICFIMMPRSDPPTRKHENIYKRRDTHNEI